MPPPSPARLSQPQVQVQPQPQAQLQSQSQVRPQQPQTRDPQNTSTSATPKTTSKSSRRHTLPFSFPPLFQSNTSSPSLIPSTAEGKPIPVDNSTAEHRTTALRELNGNFPSRHRYAKSTGAQNSTYSQPVIVRSYYSPLPNRPATKDCGIVIVKGAGGEGKPSSDSRGPAAAVRRVFPFTSNLNPPRNGMLGNMARGRGKKQRNSPEDAKLPPVEAFSFKSIMANIDDQHDGNGIHADLDRIAEICAKSRYSLSNQYEVHYAPHGSGSAFATSAPTQASQGPTLQAISSDDEHNTKRARKRRTGVRRNSRAMGTLETIMSSSRSSDEDKSKKKSAAEIADEVRGRAAMKGSAVGTPTSSSRSASDSHSSVGDEQFALQNAPARRSGSLALIDGSRQSMTPADAANPRSSAPGLVGEPAVPLTSSSQLEIRTAPEVVDQKAQSRPTENDIASREGVKKTLAQGAISSTEDQSSKPGLISALSGWLPWKAPEAFKSPAGRAEGSLRELLRGTNLKGKGVERAI